MELTVPNMDLIREAQEYLRGKINRTELKKSTTLSKMFGCELYLKMENHQKTGSFKSRGAIFRMSRLTDEERKAGVITASSGNHAQGVAYAAMINGIDAKIVMPEYSVPAKVNAVQDYGARVVLSGSDYSDSREKAEEIRKQEGRTFIEAFNCPYIISGQGTAGIEILEDLPDPDIIVVPVGGGGLISGIAIAAKSIHPSVKIIGVESEKSDSMKKSIEAGRIIPHTSGESIADGISVKYPGELTLKICSELVDDIVTVSDESIAVAIYKLLERNKTLVEPSGAAGIAALMEGKIDVKGKKVVVVLSGGNINFLLLSKIIYKSMELESKLMRIEFKIPDRPGTLSKISSVISATGGNVFHAEVDNLSEDTPVGFQTITFSINLRNSEHLSNLLKRIDELGYRYKILR
ncbi:MAG: threonine ammonia-lyase [Candidatus Thermoplasmatota archaeon]|jgi:threonine dehydratase|nr:threonine ammonia-lyase [Candidatus Thermoplasmatota archaeon]